MTKWTPTQIYAAKFLFKLDKLIRRAEEEEGDSLADDLSNLRRAMEREAFPNQDFNVRWDLKMPLHLYIDFSDDEVYLLQDIEEVGGEEKLRFLSKEYWSLSSKGAIHISHQYDRYCVSISERGREFLKEQEKGI